MADTVPAVKGFSPDLSRRGADLALMLSKLVKAQYPLEDQAQVYAGVAGTIIGNAGSYELRKSPAHAEAFLVSIMILVDSAFDAFGYDSMAQLEKLLEGWKAANGGQAVRRG